MPPGNLYVSMEISSDNTNTKTTAQVKKCIYFSPDFARSSFIYFLTEGSWKYYSAVALCDFVQAELNFNHLKRK